MLKRLFTALALCSIACLGLRAQTSGRAHHVVFVVTSGDQADWGTAMVLADHFLAGVAPERSEVEVLAYGPGISVLAKGAPTAGEMAALEAKGVHFVACESAMRAHHLAKGDLLPGVTTVPSGVVELVRKQEAGWSYVKVGS